MEDGERQGKDLGDDRNPDALRCLPCPAVMNRHGMTLIELLVTVLIVGVLASIAVPQYMKSVEVSKANAASARAAILAGAVRSYLTDFPMVTNFTSAGPLSDVCSQECCYDGSKCTTGLGDPCQLVACGYITERAFDCQPYLYYVGNSNGLPCSGGAAYACAQRQTPGGGGSCASSSAETSWAPYNGWGYWVMAAATGNGDGCVCPVNGAPAPGNVSAGNSNVAGCPAGCQ